VSANFVYIKIKFAEIISPVILYVFFAAAVRVMETSPSCPKVRHGLGEVYSRVNNHLQEFAGLPRV
jgi:hypothetical protein